MEGLRGDAGHPLATYLHAGKTYQVQVNANTGAVIGERPYSRLKIASAVLAALTGPGGRVALSRVTILITTVVVLLGAGLVLGGRVYLTGFKRTILAPVAHTSSPLSVLSHSWYWAGLLVVLAALDRQQHGLQLRALLGRHVTRIEHYMRVRVLDRLAVRP